MLKLLLPVYRLVASRLVDQERFILVCDRCPRRKATSVRQQSSGAAIIAQDAANRTAQPTPVNPAANSVAEVIDSPYLDVATSARSVDGRPAPTRELSASLAIDCGGLGSYTASLIEVSADNAVGASAELGNECSDPDRLSFSDPREFTAETVIEDAADRDSSDLLNEKSDFTDPGTACVERPQRPPKSQTSPVQRDATTVDPLDWPTDYVSQHFDQKCLTFPELKAVLLNHNISGRVLLLQINPGNLQAYLGIKALDRLEALDRIALVHQEIDRFDKPKIPRAL